MKSPTTKGLSKTIERSEQVPENVLERQCDRDTPDGHSCDDSRNVEAEIVHGENHEDRPHTEADHEAHSAQRRCDSWVDLDLPLGIPFQRVVDHSADPERALEQEYHDQHLGKNVRHIVRQSQGQRPHPSGHDENEQALGLLEQFRDQVVEIRLGLRRELLETVDREGDETPDPDKNHKGDGNRDQPLGGGDLEELRE